MSSEYGRWIRTSQSSCNSFCLAIKETHGLEVSSEILGIFYWLILGAFCQVLLLVCLGAVLVGINHLVFLEELLIEDSLSIPPYTQRHLLWVKTRLWCGWWWLILVAPQLLHSTLLFSIHFSLPVTICFTNGMFLLHLSRESYVEIWSRRFFSLNLHGTQISKLLAKLNWPKWFSVLDFDIRLSLARCNVDCSQLMSWSNCYQLQLVYPTLEHCPVKNLQHETVNHFWHAQHKSFLHFSCIFMFLVAIKRNLPKMLLFSSLLNIKMTTQKVTNFDTFFKMHTHMTAVMIQSNKIVSNEVKDKHYSRHLMEKKGMNSLANPINWK